jgi:hypothetical protein
MTCATVCVAIFTLALFIAAILQWREMDASGKQTDRLLGLYQQQLSQLTKQSADTHDLAVRTKDLADAAAIAELSAEKSAKASQDFALTAAKIDAGVGDAVQQLSAQAQTARDSIYLEQRPWVGIEVISVPTDPNLIRSITPVSSVQIVARNTGRTPALMFHNVCCDVITLDSEDDIPDYNAIEAKKSTEKDAREADSLRRAIESDPSHADRMRAIFKDSKEREAIWDEQHSRRSERIYVIPPNTTIPLQITYSGPDDSKYHFIIGKLIYKDPIDKTKEHTTKFCLVGHRTNPLQLCRTGQDEN